MFNRSPVCEVCLNNEVTKPWTGTSPNLGSFDYCYVAILNSPPRLLYSAARCPPKGATHSCPSSHSISGRPVCTRTGSSAHLGVPCLRPSILKSLRLPRLLLHKSAQMSFSRICPSFASPHHPSIPNVQIYSSQPTL